MQWMKLTLDLIVYKKTSHYELNHSGFCIMQFSSFYDT